MSTSMRGKNSCHILTAIQSTKHPKADLSAYFSPLHGDNAAEEKQGALRPFVYKPGTPFEIRILLRNHLKLPREFFCLAKSILECSEFFEENYQLIETFFVRQRFALSLLMDAARHDGTFARRYLLNLYDDPKYEPAIIQIIETQGFTLTRDSSHIDAHEFWSFNKPLETIPQMEKFIHDLQEKGAMGHDYFLCYPCCLDEFKMHMQMRLAALVQQKEPEIQRMLAHITQAANQGKLTEVRLQKERLLDFTRTHSPSRLASLTKQLQQLNHLVRVLTPTVEHLEQKSSVPKIAGSVNSLQTPPSGTRKKPRIAPITILTSIQEVTESTPTPRVRFKSISSPR